MPTRRVITERSQEPRRRFAEELRALRSQHGESFRRLGEIVGWDPTMFQKMECGETLGGPEVVQALDTHYKTGTMLLTLWELAMGDKSQFREQYRRYMLLESEAISMWQYSASMPPGLLQTESYAREAIAAGGTTGKELDQQVEARTSRRQLLCGKAQPAFRVILSETVLRTPLRDPQEWREQLTYLIEASDRPNITIHVVPLNVGVHALANSDVMFLRLTDGRTVAYTEDDVRGTLIEETSRVEPVQRRYDAVRDLALSPAESRAFMTQMLEEAPCDA